jgi:hypothetical protein
MYLPFGMEKDAMKRCQRLIAWPAFWRCAHKRAARAYLVKRADFSIPR